MSWTVAIGVDTHKEEHVAVACDRLGRQLDSFVLPATSRGYLGLWAWAQALGEPVFAVEGAGSYGAGLARFLAAAGGRVYECERPARRERRRGKSDLIDAALAARRLVAGQGLSAPRGGGVREDLRLLLLERRGLVRAETAVINQLHAVVVAAPAGVRERLAGRSSGRLVAACARVRAHAEHERVLVQVLRRLSRRARSLARELAALDRELDQLVAALVPELLEECGVGPVCAAQLLVSSGDPVRMRSEASFAALAGTSPVDASSGRQRRHRLNRGGDRQLNRALHTIALARVRHHDETARYYQRLLDSGKSAREARRCIKRALARHFYRRLRELPQLQELAPTT
jgi:transposase